MLDEIYRQPLIDDLCAFIRIPSRSSAQGGEEGRLQALIAARMEALGARVRVFEPDDIPEFRRHPLCCGSDRQYAGRPTVIGELGPPGAPALLVAAHSDTVQITAPAEWSFDPFCGELRDGAVRGLGASDDKWGLATLLTLMRALVDTGRPLRKRILFASTIDEENGVANGLLLLALAGLQAEGALYLDGYQMQIFVGCLGGSNLYLRPREPVPPEMLARHTAQLDAACHAISRERSALFTHPLYIQNAMRERSVFLNPQSGPDGPLFILHFYTLPGEERGAICRALEAMVATTLGAESARYRQEYREPWFEAAPVPLDIPLIGHLSHSVRAVLGTEPQVTTVSKQDTFALTKYGGIPTVSFGCVSQITGRGAFHHPDEYLSVTDLWNGCRVAYEAVCRWLES